MIQNQFKLARVYFIEASILGLFIENNNNIDNR